MLIEIGRWAVVPGAFPHTADVRQIDEVTPRQIRTKWKSNPLRYEVASRDGIYATFATRGEADALRHRIESIRAEVIQRQRAATIWGDKTLLDVVAKAQR